MMKKIPFDIRSSLFDTVRPPFLLGGFIIQFIYIKMVLFVQKRLSQQDHFPGM